MNEPLQNEFDIVEDALRTWPRAQTPRGFSARVLRQIETAPRYTLKFRLTWLDLSLGLFTVLMPLVLVFVWKSLPPRAILHLRFQMIVLQSTPGLCETLSLVIVAAAILFGLLALAACVWFSSARRPITHSPST